MHRDVRPHPPLPLPSGLSGGGETLVMGRLHLPPSIPVSKDGEEGALAYHLGLLQSNADSRPERYQAPPNRTIDRGDDNFGLSFHSHYATSTTKMLSSSSRGSGNSKTLSQSDVSCPVWERTHYGGKPVRESAPDTEKNTDLMTLKSSHEVLVVAQDRDMTRAEQAEKKTRSGQKQRSSSADGVRRIINKYSFLRNLSRKHACTKTSSPHSCPQAALPLPVPPEKEMRDLVSVAGVLSEAGSPSGQKPPPWELPPNYVDMIFIKDSMTSVGVERDVTKKQQLKQQLPQHLFEQQKTQPSTVTSPEITQTTKIKKRISLIH